MTNLNEHKHDQSYADKTKFSQQNVTVSVPITVRYVLPIPKQVLKDRKLLEELFMESIIAVQKCLPTEKSSQITIFKSTIQRKKGNLKAITVIFPSIMRTDAKQLLTQGITINGRTIPPYSIEDPSISEADYPKMLRISFRNVPHCLSKDEIITSCGLETFNLDDITHQQRRLPNRSLFFTGMARAGATIENLEEEERLKEWSKKAYRQSFNCHGVIFQCCCLNFANHTETTSQDQNLQPPETDKQPTQTRLEGKQAKLPNDKEEVLEEYITKTPPQSDVCENEQKQNAQDDTQLDETGTSTAENSEQDEPMALNDENGKDIYYLDEEKRHIYNEETTIARHPGAEKYTKNRNKIGILDEKGEKINQLRYLEMLDEDAQDAIFQKHKLKLDEKSLETLYQFTHYRGRYSVFIEYDLHLIFTVNLSGSIKQTFKIIPRKEL